MQCPAESAAAAAAEAAAATSVPNQATHAKLTFSKLLTSQRPRGRSRAAAVLRFPLLRACVANRGTCVQFLATGLGMLHAPLVTLNYDGMSATAARQRAQHLEHAI